MDVKAEFVQYLNDLIVSKLGAGAIIEADTSAIQPFLVVPTTHLVEICQLLHTYEELYFDMLSLLTSVDQGVGSDPRFWIVYHLYSVPFGRGIVLKCPAGTGTDGQPQVPSLNHIWRTADWHEREAYDLMGIHFTGHPDLRRILLPEDWEGHPLRKDYKTADEYHGIEIDY